MARLKYSDLQLKMILNEVAAKYPNTELNPNLLGKLSDIPRHIWKMRMKSELEIINDCNFVKEQSSLVSKKTGESVTIINYFDEFLKLAQMKDMDGILRLAKDIMEIHYRLLSIAATKEEHTQIHELEQMNNTLRESLASREEEIKSIKRAYELRLEQAEKQYYKLAVCALGGFQEKGIKDVKTVSPFKNNKAKAVKLLNKEFL
ncbi:D52 family tumor protein [Paenibacillus sp. TRM 82003]|nr:D52 family tumor protein [Paenibacillus sp. TRM 82003]MCI3923414.1 D52 family tumor protein [Paenibacillus sp. TRM 82003]